MKQLYTHAATPPHTCNKAGILPFIRAATTPNWRICVMKPIATRPGKAPPPFQLAKGTRMHTLQGLWQDMKDGEAAHEPAETLLQTALREGLEEIGLIEKQIIQLYDCGPVSFTSVKTGEVKWMWLFAAEMPNEQCLSAEVASTTLERAWLSVAEFETQGRDDHLPVIQTAVKAIAAS